MAKPNLAIRNSVALIATKGMLAAARIGFLLWTAHLQSPAAFSQLAFCFALIEVLRVAADFGSENLFVRKLAQAGSPHEHRQLMAQMAAVRIAATIVGVAVYGAVAYFSFAGDTGAMTLLPAALLTTSLTINFAFTYYQSQLRTERMAVRVIALSLPSLAVFLWLRDAPSRAQLQLLIAFEVLVGLALLWDLRRQLSLRTRDVLNQLRWPTLRATAIDALPLGGAALLVTAYTRLDIFALQHLAGAVALGLYSFAYRITEPFRFVGGAVDSTIYSILSKKFAAPSGALHSVINRTISIVATYSVVFGGAAIAIGLILIKFLYAAYTEAQTAVTYLGAALIMRCANGAMTAFQNALGHYRLNFRIAIINGIFMGILIWPLTAWAGATGAALALLIVESINFTMQSYFMSRSRLILVSREAA